MKITLIKENTNISIVDNHWFRLTTDEGDVVDISPSVWEAMTKNALEYVRDVDGGKACIDHGMKRH